MSGMPDFPGLPIMVTARDKAFFDKSQALGHAGPPGFGPPFTETPFNWQVFDFEGGPYLGFARSHDVHGDGSVVCVPAPGHTRQHHHLHHPPAERAVRPRRTSANSSSSTS